MATLVLDKETVRPVENTPPAPPAKGAMLVRVFQLLERAGVPWVVLHGYERYPDQVDSDVDLLVGRDWVPDRIVALLVEHEAELGASVVQWLDDGAQFIVLAGRADDGSLYLLQLHVTADYHMCGRVLVRGEQILQSRRRHEQMWVPSVCLEFVCVLANRICKGNLTPIHTRRLSALFQQDLKECGSSLSRFFGTRTRREIQIAGASGKWDAVVSALPRLRQELLASRAVDPLPVRIENVGRRVRRWARPQNGLHVVFLGPDGVGKSTVIEAVSRELRDAFLHCTYLTFAPSLLPARLAPAKPGGPHSLPPRSRPASLLKAAWWSVCYTLGYFVSVHPTRARAGLVINHRYLLDAWVDPYRYRYAGPRRLLRWIWAVAPKPDLVMLLDAPPEVILQRKSELPAMRIVELRDGYLAAVTPLRNGHVIDAAQPVARVVREVEDRIIRYLSDRVRGRLDDAAASAAGGAT
jgi:thymidylate kinase